MINIENKKMNMKHLCLTFITLICFCIITYGQRIPQVPDSVRKKYKVAQPPVAPSKSSIDLSLLNQDSLIKVKLIKLALNNPAIEIADAGIRIAESDLARAKSSWLGSFNASANINEFVVQGSPAANFFPKYNLGISLPLDILSKLKSEKKVAKENILISNELKKDKEQILKAQVLIAYEIYKEKKEIVFLEKSNIEFDYSAYEAAQKAFADGEITLDEMNKTNQVYINEKAVLVSKEKELNIAIIQLEQLVGIPLAEALKL